MRPANESDGPHPDRPAAPRRLDANVVAYAGVAIVLIATVFGMVWLTASPKRVAAAVTTEDRAGRTEEAEARAREAIQRELKAQASERAAQERERKAQASERTAQERERKASERAEKLESTAADAMTRLVRQSRRQARNLVDDAKKLSESLDEQIKTQLVQIAMLHEGLTELPEPAPQGLKSRAQGLATLLDDASEDLEKARASFSDRADVLKKLDEHLNAVSEKLKAAEKKLKEAKDGPPNARRKLAQKALEELAKAFAGIEQVAKTVEKINLGPVDGDSSLPPLRGVAAIAQETSRLINVASTVTIKAADERAEQIVGAAQENAQEIGAAARNRFANMKRAVARCLKPSRDRGVKDGVRKANEGRRLADVRLKCLKDYQTRAGL